jgi:hypothetical protein
MIRHFGIYPSGFDKDDLFDEQKIFLMYLVGSIPTMEIWERNVSYQIKREEIKNIKTIKLDQYDIDMARLQKKNLSELKKQRLIEHKKQEILKLNESFGIKEEVKEIERHIEFKDKENHDPNKLWKMLQGEGLTNG